LLLGGVTSGISVLNANNATPNIVSGGTYWLGVQNTNSFNVNYGIGVDFRTTNFIDMPLSVASAPGAGAQLQWYGAPDARYQVEWATNLSSPIFWTTNTTVITNLVTDPTSWVFTFDDPGSTNSYTRYYRLIQL
jgi:hypothetical protein